MASGSKFKNPLDSPKLYHHMSFHAKNQTSSFSRFVHRHVRLEKALSHLLFLWFLYRHPPIIKWEVKNRTLPMALAKRLVLLGWNFACMPLWAKLADSSRRFLISALEAEIWVPLGGWHGGPKITKKFCFQFWVFLVRSLILRCFKIDYRKKWPYLDVLVGFNLNCYPCSVTLAERNFG